MRRPERISIIKKISEKLAVEEYSTIDLVLKHFPLPVSESWGGSSKIYIISVIEGAEDSVLEELLECVENLDGGKEVSKTPEFWDQDHYRLFISHISEHSKDAAILQSYLKLCGISAFVAHNDIEPTQEWHEKIVDALKTCDGLLAYLTPGFNQSLWTDQEVGYALGRDVKVVLLNKGLLPYGLMGKYQVLHAGNLSPLNSAIEIMKVISKDKGDMNFFSDFVVSSLEKTEDYATSSNCMTIINNFEKLTEAQLSRIRIAYETNGQFNGVSYMEGRVKGLFSRHNKSWA